MRIVILSLAMAVLVFSFLPGCSHIKTEPVTQYVDDSTITTEAKWIIANDPDAQFFKIKVKTIQGKVELDGFVTNNKTESRLVDKILALDGVKSVTSRLQLMKK